VPERVEILDALEALARAGAPLVVVGVGGINFYARDASEVVATEDLDLLLAPRTDALRTALAALDSLGFSFAAGDEPFVDIQDDAILANVVRAGACIRARHDSGAALDLMLSGKGLAWDEVTSDAVAFQVGDAEIRVGRLERLLRAKELAGRPKDVEFLRMFAARFADEDPER
jgi:CTP:molybdopterin cytidylyltransferase MocA